MTTRLEGAGYVTRKKDPHARKRNLISLTSKGESLIKEIKQVWADVDVYIEEKIGTDKMAELSELTLLLKTELGGRRPGDTE